MAKNKQLEGFKWIPEARPKSKEEIIPTLKANPAARPGKTVKPVVEPKPKPVAPPKKPVAKLRKV